MKKQAYQVPELRDANNNIIQEGTYGRTSPLVTIDNAGVLDYINNNLEALHDALLGDRVYVDSAKDLPNPGDVSVTYITGDSGDVYYYDPATATYTAINQGKEYAEKTDYQKAITSATANGATITFNHKDGTTSTATVNNVASATAATNDAKGQKIDATYEKIVDASNVRTSLQNSINGLSSSKQDKLTFDSTPTADSPNPVTSGGVKTALDKKADTSSLKTVATSGSYNDLTDRPTIPTVPTKVSAFTNDAGYLTAHQSLSNYYTKTQVDTAISNAIASITDGDSNSY